MLDPDVLILRDPKESAHKCSLTPLRGLPDIRFVEHRAERRIDAAGRILLHAEGELLSAADADSSLFLIDCSWRRVTKLQARVDGDPVLRRLPPLLLQAIPRHALIIARVIP